MSASIRMPGWSSVLPVLRPATLLDGALLLLLACAVRLLWLGDAPLWVDEQFSVFWSQLDASFILGQGARVETNPPAYYWLLHGWTGALGSSPSAVRLPSALLSAATVLVVYGIGRNLFDTATARLAAVLAAFDPAAVLFAQEARPYALTALADALALFALAGYLRRGLDQRWPWLLLFILAAIGAFLAHYTSLLFIAALFGAIGLSLLTTRPFPLREGMVWLLAALIIAVGIAKPFVTAISLTSSTNIAWIKPLTLAAVRVFFMDVLIHPEVPYSALWVGACAALVLMIAIAVPRFRLDRAQFTILILTPALFCVLLIAASAARPMLIARVGVWLTIPLCLLLAHAAIVQPSPWRRAIHAGISLSILLIGLGHYYRFYEKEDWQRAARLVADDPRCGGPIVFGAASGLGLVFYEPALARRTFYAALSSQAERMTAEFLLAERVLSPRLLDADDVAAFTATHPGTAIVMRSIYLDGAPASLRQLIAAAPLHAELRRGMSVSCY